MVITSSYRDLADRAFLADLSHFAESLSAQIPVSPGQNPDWVVYGSRVTGTATAASDVDVLMLHDDEGRPPVRIDAHYNGVPVTVYALSWSALRADGEHRTYGGYFALKLFSPFVCTRPECEVDLVGIVARFLGPLAARQASPGTERTRHQVLADSYLAFLDLHPAFDSYAARALTAPLLASPTWVRQAQVMIEAYEASGLVRPVSAGRYVYAETQGAEDWSQELAITAARFWAFGAVCHGADAAFPDHYRTKARSRTTALHRRRVVEEIRRIAGGRCWR